ncbi:GCN5-related N-acetyltransferase [Denitrovibrio acetiphilus DSM 12809]|uniref:GCN5-related N-acetyltransferase n=1 Tax=Denitrovibrio acetiphilus (strain DSM 12809 / NBRC 114555 / N2460) TaxID=522772 RepID=D4H830_DENA2|nr:N-acetyltransferase [Denitrovibrio acetiphilus]ADD68179.1 GCN5-related N-acetyltransferase [Denitrovibrio acetiphilus DSM 12809]
MIRKALMTDAKDIQNLVNTYAKGGEMLPLSINEIYEKILEFVVWEENGELIGCCAIHPTWDNLAEIRSVAVRPDTVKKGVGKALVERSIETAAILGITKVFLLTYVPEFFRKLGFTEVEKEMLPKKIWSDCLKCAKFPDCDEIAMMKTL